MTTYRGLDTSRQKDRARHEVQIVIFFCGWGFFRKYTTRQGITQTNLVLHMLPWYLLYGAYRNKLSSEY